MCIDVKPKTIFLVEDNQADIRLIQEALKDVEGGFDMVIARDGIEALSCLRGSEGNERVYPDLILLDLNLPRKDGREVLADIKSDPDLKHIPVIVLTTSRSEEDIMQSYHLHVNCFISKSRNLDQLFQIARRIKEFWLETATLPHNLEPLPPSA
ncbi:MAG: response regulator [Spirulina sp. SIO3F2]|nr:response regulator [Spirulina sp. SIO3F2]